MSQNNGGVGAGTVILAFLAGAAVGGVVALLYAPQSGSKTRQKILEMGDDARETMARVPTAMREAERAAVETFAEALRKG
ncbi:MAG TPA: YtxH domain-containing protein [Anaeromyxobacteraceae bacterium]|nr:YtxH domain-containing protein [Anaeromyxobacteraceae bacterium]